MNWQPIENAPRDGSEVLVAGPAYGCGPGYYRAIGTYHDGEWYDDYENSDSTLHAPTLWMPLPDLPPDHNI